MGSLRFCGYQDPQSGPNQWSALDNHARHAIAVDFNNMDEFPYLNNTSSPIIVDVSFGGNSDDFVGYNETRGAKGDDTGDVGEEQFDSPNVNLQSLNVNTPNGTDAAVEYATAGIRDIVKIKGIIPPGRNEMILVYDAINPNSAATGAVQNDFVTMGFCPAFFNHGTPIVINFSFTMHTNWNSYNRIILDTAGPGPGDDDENESP